MGLANGDRVRVTTESGRQIDVAVAAATGDELPPGLLFIAYGDLSSQLMDGDTHGSGMPTSKGFDVTWRSWVNDMSTACCHQTGRSVRDRHRGLHVHLLRLRV